MEDINQQIDSIMCKVAGLPAVERQALLDKIKQSVDRTEALCSEESARDTSVSSEGNWFSSQTYQVVESAVQTRASATTKRKVPPSRLRRFNPNSPQLSLACPVCQLKLTSWLGFLNHLNSGHSQSSVTSICRRCRGIFRNHALLLSHECYQWGRMNLPCAAVYSSIEDSPILNSFGFPPEGVYIERRCGLCMTSDVVYSNFEQYERHKFEEHAESGSRALLCDIQRPQNKIFQAPASALISSNSRRKTAKSKLEKSVAIKADGNHIGTAEPSENHVGEPRTDANVSSSTYGPPSKDSTNETVAAAAEPSGRIFSCRICKLFFRSRERLLRHEKTSTVHNRRLSRCRRFRLNSSTATRATALEADGVSNPDETGQEEAASVAGLGRPHTCHLCGLVYTRKHALERHLAHAHSGGGGGGDDETAGAAVYFRCEFCAFRALDRTNFRQHMARHFHLKNFACEHCEHRCITKQELDDHVRFKHSDKRDFKCPECQATFKTAGTLRRHRKTHRNISYACSECNASFNRMSNLKRHRNAVHSSAAPSGTRRGRGRPQKSLTTTATARQKQRLAVEEVDGPRAPQSMGQDDHQSTLSSLVPIWEYDNTRVHSGSVDQLCTSVVTTGTTNGGMEPVYVAFDSETGWIPANSVGPTADESLLVHPHQHQAPPPRNETVLPCVSDIFSSYLPTATTLPSSQSAAPEGGVTPHSHPHHHTLWRSEVENPSSSGVAVSDDLISDLFVCDVVVGAEEDVVAQHSREGGGEEEADDVAGSGTNFTVGYLIGGGGGGGGGGGVLTREGGERELHALPASDCLSLVPIVNGTESGDRFASFWAVSCPSSGTAVTAVESSSAAEQEAVVTISGMSQEHFQGFEQHQGGEVEEANGEHI